VQLAQAARIEVSRTTPVMAGKSGSGWGRRAIRGTETLAKGDVAYIPQGYGRSIENIGSEPGPVLIRLNTGDYQAIDLSLWMASGPSSCSPITSASRGDFDRSASGFLRIGRSNVSGP
jgi:hypothetical protein